MCCAPAPLTRAHAYWRIYAFEIPAPLASPSPPHPPSPSPPPSLALPSASPPPAVSEVDGVRFTLVSEYSKYSPSPPPPPSPVAAGGAVVAFFAVGDEAVGGAIVFVVAFAFAFAFIFVAYFVASFVASIIASFIDESSRVALPRRVGPTVIVGPKDGDGAVLVEAVVLEAELKAEPPPLYQASVADAHAQPMCA